jgi:hypothetical protein
MQIYFYKVRGLKKNGCERNQGLSIVHLPLSPFTLHYCNFESVLPKWAALSSETSDKKPKDQGTLIGIFE